MTGGSLLVYAEHTAAIHIHSRKDHQASPYNGRGFSARAPANLITIPTYLAHTRKGSIAVTAVETRASPKQVPKIDAVVFQG